MATAPEGRQGTTSRAAPAGRSPSPPWFGAMVMALLVAGAAWLLSYTLLDLSWQQAAGAWNYLIALVLSGAAGQLLRRWRGEPHR